MSELDRRTFLARSGMSVAAAALFGARAAGMQSARAQEGNELDPQSWTSVRDQFDLDPSFIHLAAFVLASHPRVVRQAIEEHRRGLDIDPYGYVGENETALEDEVRATAAAYLGVEANEIALTDSTTMGLALVYNGLVLEDGEEILATTHDFYSTHESIRARNERVGTPFRIAPLYRDISTVTEDEIAESVRKAIRPETRALAVTWVHSSTGLKLPLRRIADTLEEVNRSRDETDRVLLCVDAVHGFGNQDESPLEMGCDVFVSGTHKWLFGPRGTGIVWATLAAWERIVPTIPSFSPEGFQAWITGEAPPRPTPGPYQTPGGFHSFENRWALKDAFRFHLDIGRDRVAARTVELATRLKEGLTEVSSIRSITPMDPALSAGLVCFGVSGRDPWSVVEALMRLRRISASVTPYAEPYVRLGPTILNSEEEIDETLRVLRAIT